MFPRRCRARCRRQPAATAPPPNRSPVGSWLGHRKAGEGHCKNHPVVTKQSWRATIKLSTIIDNLIPAMVEVIAMDGKGGQARRQAAMAVLAHADTVAIAGCL